MRQIILNIEPDNIADNLFKFLKENALPKYHNLTGDLSNISIKPEKLIFGINLENSSLENSSWEYDSISVPPNNEIPAISVSTSA